MEKAFILAVRFQTLHSNMVTCEEQVISNWAYTEMLSKVKLMPGGCFISQELNAKKPQIVGDNVQSQQATADRKATELKQFKGYATAIDILRGLYGISSVSCENGNTSEER